MDNHPYYEFDQFFFGGAAGSDYKQSLQFRNLNDEKENIKLPVSCFGASVMLESRVVLQRFIILCRF